MPNRLLSFLASILDPRSWIHLLRIVHFYSYAHVRERRKVQLGSEVGIAPNVSFRHGERIEIGDRSRIGEHSCIWAGRTSGRIVIGKNLLGAPQLFITAGSFSKQPGKPMRDQPMREEDVVIGDDVWLGVRVVVVAGVTIGDHCIVGANSVVTRDLPPGSIAVGAPARVIGTRGASAEEGEDAGP